MSHIYCQECGFQNPEAANYCARCGALLVKDEGGAETTQTFTPDDGDESPAEALEDLGVKGPALVVRSGGGRSRGDVPARGRDDDRALAGLRDLPRRRHRLAQARGRCVERDGGFFIEDQGSLNGTFVNRKRVESAQLEDGDELQIGKYRLTFFDR